MAISPNDLTAQQARPEPVPYSWRDDFIDYRPMARVVPEYGLLYYDHIFSEYILLSPQISNDDRGTISAINTRRLNDRLTWHDIYTFELILLRYRDLRNLKNKVMDLREKFRVVAGQKNFDIYLASKPPDPTTEDPAPGAPEEEKQLEIWRKDCERLLHAFFLYYSFLSAREHMRDKMLKLAVILTVGVCFLAVIVLWLVSRTTLALVCFAGIIGAFVSMLLRLQSAPSVGDPVYEFAVLRHGRFGIFLSPIMGGIFAVLLYVMFAGGVLSGKFFPKIANAGETAAPLASPSPTATPSPSPSVPASPSPSPRQSPTISPTATRSPTSTAQLTSPTPRQSAMTVATTALTAATSPTTISSSGSTTQKQIPVTLKSFLDETGGANHTEFALLIIWSFIAGFAERLVPDALSRLVTKSEIQKARDS